MITQVDNAEQLKLHDGITMFTFSTPKCVPCKLMNPLMDKVAGKSDYIHIYRINCEAVPELADKYNVISVPTVYMFYNKQLKHVLHSLIGIKHELESLV